MRRVEPGLSVQIECAEGSISATNVLLTTNAFITKLDFLRRDVFPMIACASLSRPLTDDEQAAMGGAARLGDHGVCDGAADALEPHSGPSWQLLFGRFSLELRACGGSSKLRTKSGVLKALSPCSPTWTSSTPGPASSA